MFEKLELTRMAQALASHSGARLGVIARNIANADTPGYGARDLQGFDRVYAAWDRTARHQEIELRGPRDPNGNGVRLEDQMTRMAAVRQDHEMALAVQRSTSAIVRAALGRGGA